MTRYMQREREKGKVVGIKTYCLATLNVIIVNVTFANDFDVVDIKYYISPTTLIVAATKLVFPN